MNPRRSRDRVPTGDFDDAPREWAPMGFDVDVFKENARLTATP